MKILDLNCIIKVRQKENFVIQLKEKIISKYNLLTGDSATLKTTVINISKFQDTFVKRGNYFIDFSKNKIHLITSFNELLSDELYKYDLCICDENISNEINTVLFDSSDNDHKTLTESLKNATTKFLFICRDMPSLPIAYYSIFELDRQFDKTILTKLFEDSYLNFNAKNRIVTEDSKTGFEYYSYHFNDVISANGKSKIYSTCLSTDTVVADGSAIGLELKHILSKTNDVYLPESFEYDLATHWLPNNRLVKNYLGDMPDDCASVEQYFEHVVLPALCVENHMPMYSKSRKLHPVLLNVKIHDDSKSLFEKFSTDHGLTFDEAYTQYSALYDTNDLDEIINYLKEDDLI